MKIRLILTLLAVPFIMGAEGNGCQPARQQGAMQEQAAANRQQEHMLRMQPIPTLQWSLERHLAIQIYMARQRSVPTVSIVQSEYTGKILWRCDSIGFPLPYATQITNPLQMMEGRGSPPSTTAVNQAEPNGLYTPSSADGTWVPCVDDKGGISPVYEERKISTFPRSVREENGTLIIGGPSSLSITTKPSP